ncbi:MAG: hypothetical protein IJ506_07480 [Clostridia bacterium]|nr:hypothetical protein [Clostridia bacterium]MBQ8658962.1 hypothetical protein [Clostridia bacterium]
MKKRNVVAICMAMAMTASLGLATACTSTSTDGELEVSIINYDGGAGRIWLDEAADRFEKLNKTTDFGGGYVGVSIKVDNQQSISTATMKTDGYNLYFLEGGQSIRSLAQQGYLLDLTEAITTPLTEYGEDKTIESKIAESYRAMEKGADGKYYGIPHVEYYSGISYDIDAWEKYSLYFAEEGGTSYTSKFGSANFCKTGAAGAKKTVGPDGKANTEDDGMPSSLTELLVLCARMKNTYDISPFGTSGKTITYTNFLVSSLWASLAGYQKMQTCYTFSGSIDAVTGYEETPLFAHTDGKYDKIKKPKTESVTVTEETGYRVYDMVERYYATAFLEIAENEGWFDWGTTHGAEYTTAQYRFICSGATVGGVQQDKIGMYVDGSYWYNESNGAKANNFADYYDLMPPGTPERQIGWMSLPVSLDTTVTESNGKDAATLEVALSNAFVNGNIANNAPMKKACTDFLRFLYTDAELQNFTALTGIPKAVNYSLGEKESELDAFQKTIWAKHQKTNGVLYASADNKTFLSSIGSFNLYSAAEVFKYGGFKCYFDAFSKDATGALTSQTIFEATKMTTSLWNTIYKGDANE